MDTLGGVSTLPVRVTTQAVQSIPVSYNRAVATSMAYFVNDPGSMLSDVMAIQGTSNLGVMHGNKFIGIVSLLTGCIAIEIATKMHRTAKKINDVIGVRLAQIKAFIGVLESVLGCVMLGARVIALAAVTSKVALATHRIFLTVGSVAGSLLYTILPLPYIYQGVKQMEFKNALLKQKTVDEQLLFLLEQVTVTKDEVKGMESAKKDSVLLRKMACMERLTSTSTVENLRSVSFEKLTEKEKIALVKSVKAKLNSNICMNGLVIFACAIGAASMVMLSLASGGLVFTIGLALSITTNTFMMGFDSYGLYQSLSKMKTATKKDIIVQTAILALMIISTTLGVYFSPTIGVKIAVYCTGMMTMMMQSAALFYTSTLLGKEVNQTSRRKGGFDLPDLAGFEGGI